MKDTFIESAQRHFQFLVSEFGFTLLKATPSPRGEEWEGEIIYQNYATSVTVNASRGEMASVWIARTKDDNEHLLPIEVIYEYKSLDDKEKATVLDIDEKRQARTILATKRLANLIPGSASSDARKEIQLDVYVTFLRTYCSHILQGDFSEWLGIWEYHIRKLTVEHARGGLPEYIPVVITDQSGQSKVVGKKHVFQKDMDYLMQLKNEYGVR